ncbi:ABC-F family ATP-binding cassette domain-containing protein [Luteococcus sp. OSA5]|uniref:ABC-F family ATP-binding cassette domain-containing protein n=1 Tax=Luteococcus sp. OSA5 TaxID=3401630 RepID=UPI003B43CD90
MLVSSESSSSATHLRLDGVSKSYAAQRVLTNVSFSVAAGDCAALIGENGRGKSTILRLVAGLEESDGGEITRPESWAIHHQQPPFDAHDTMAAIQQSALAPVRHHADEVSRIGEAMARHPEDESLSAQLSEAIAAAERTAAWQVDHRWELLLEGLGLAGLAPDRTAGELSGGQAARLSLAWVLVRRSELLLLDEPTNHLDDRATEMVTQTIKDWPGPVLLASHDRAFLDETVTSLVDLDPAPRPHRGPGAAAPGLTRFTGSFSEYLAHRRDQRERWQRQYEQEQEELDRLRGRVKQDQQVGHTNWTPRSETRMAQKFYSDRNATVVSRRVNDARTALARLEEEQVRKPPRELRFRGLDAATAHTDSATGRRQGESPQAGPVLVATSVSVEGRLGAVSLSIGARDRWLVEGPNGCGKSTLLRVLAGHLAPSHGNLSAASRLSVGLLEQEPESVDPYLTARQTYALKVGEQTAEQVPLGTFGLLPGRDENRPVGELSVGQRRRLDLACVLASPPDVLLLDEPTNHFSLQLATELEDSLTDYPGAIVVASHDRWLRRRWQGRRLRLP